MSKRLFAWLGLAALVIVLDQITKKMVLKYFLCGMPLDIHYPRTCQGSVDITRFFDLVFVLNKGAAFGFLADHPGWQRWFFIILAIVICSGLVFMLAKHAHEKLQPLAFALVIGGALGNVIDRGLYGAVVDFLSFHIGGYSWPAFNVADSAICVGVVLMVLAQWQASRREKLEAENTTQNANKNSIQ